MKNMIDHKRFIEKLATDENGILDGDKYSEMIDYYRKDCCRLRRESREPKIINVNGQLKGVVC